MGGAIGMWLDRVGLQGCGRTGVWQDSGGGLWVKRGRRGTAKKGGAVWSTQCLVAMSCIS